MERTAYNQGLERVDADGAFDVLHHWDTVSSLGRLNEH